MKLFVFGGKADRLVPASICHQSVIIWRNVYHRKMRVSICLYLLERTGLNIIVNAVLSFMYYL